MAKLKTYKGLKAKADKLFSEVIRSVGYCESCDGTHYLQTAHIISRRYNTTRTDTRNAYCLCAKCHRFYTDHPRQFSRFISTTWAAETYDELFEFSQNKAVKKVDWQQRVDFLTSIKNKEITLKQARELEGK
jgi:hypothetical protein